MYDPKYFITHNVLKNIGSIDAAREIIEHAALVPAWEAKFREDALSRTVHHGTRLEGNSLNLEQAQKLVQVNASSAQLAAQKAGVIGRDRDIQEVINYRKVMDWIESKNKDKSKDKKAPHYTEDIIKKIHKLTSKKLLPTGQSGIYRKVEVVVKNSHTGEVSFKPPAFVEVPYQMEEFFAWLNSPSGGEHHPVIRAGIIHYELVRIHPFVDGNGRSARAMALLALYLEGYNVKRFFSLEEYFDHNASSYYQALQSVGQGKKFDLTYWLEYFTLGLAVELDRVKQLVLKLSRDISLKKKLGRQVALTQRQIKILQVMENSGRVLSSQLTQVVPNVSVDTILRDLKDLMKKDLVKKKGKTKGAFYVLAE